MSDEYIRNDPQEVASTHVCDLPELNDATIRQANQRAVTIRKKANRRRIRNNFTRWFLDRYTFTTAPVGSVFFCEECSATWGVFRSNGPDNSWEAINKRHYDKVKKKRLKGES